MDFWGLSNNQALEYILEKDSFPNKVIHRTPKSTAQERDYLFLRLEHFLEENNFFATKEMKPSVMNNDLKK